MALLEAHDLVKRYPAAGRRRGGNVAALRGVSLGLDAGECVAVVGESGSGKSTLARCLVRLTEPDSGRVLFAGEDLTALCGEPLRWRRRYLQMTFPDAGASLDPRMRVAAILEEPLRAFGLGDRDERRERVLKAMDQLRLPPTLAGRFPGELSGGQRQRVAFGRAVIVRPRVLVADEPVSALDGSLRAQALEILRELRDALGLGLLLIAHDLELVSRMADRVLVLDGGAVVEQGPTREVLRAPRHPRTAALVAASRRNFPCPDS
ncbi:MAG: ATP-binding cassette domain-containing protein [Thermoanaerobaculia bacterium]